MSGTRARAGAIVGLCGMALGGAVATAGSTGVGFALVLAGATALTLTSNLSLPAQVGLGFAAGAAAGGACWVLPDATLGLGPVDDAGWLFVRLLKMLVGPLVFLAITSGLARAGSLSGLGRMGVRTLALYLATMAAAVTVGLALVQIFEPGVGSSLLELPFFRDRLEATELPRPEAASFRSFVGALLENPLASLASPNPPILALVAAAFVVGMAIVRLGERAAPVAAFLESAYELVLEIIGWFVRLAPVGVMAIVWSLLGSLADAGAGSLVEALRSVASFIFVVFLATCVHAFVTLPAFAWALAGVSPIQLLRGISEALMVAFSTSSSAATLPVTTRNVESQLGVPRRVSSFVLPLGSTVNMDGTALYEAIAALFVAGLFGVELSFGSQVIVFGMSMLMAVGAPAIPSAGMVTMIAVLQAVGLPGEAVALLIPLDRLLDTVRTMANVEGDAVVAVCVARAENG